MIKNNKIMVCVSTSTMERQKMLAELAVKCGFAMVRSDAKKLIKMSVYDIDIPSAFFVIADNFKFSESPSTTQRLFELATRGIAVLVGTKKLPVQYEFLCDVYYPEHLL